MVHFLEREHNTKGPITKFHNRMDLDTQLKCQGCDGLYGKSEQAQVQRELHEHLVKRALQVGEQQAKMEVVKGRMFNKEDMKNL
jgi:hypothetical protein